MEAIFCPICGQQTVKLEIDGRLRNTCSDRHFIQFATVAMSVGALVLKNDSVLLVKHNIPSKPWALPGGYLEQDESLANCVVREVQEETGLSIIPVGILALRQLVKEDRNEFYIIFLAECEANSVVINPNNDEILDARFVNLNELEAYNVTDFVKRIIFGYQREKPELLKEFMIANYNLKATMFGNL